MSKLRLKVRRRVCEARVQPPAPALIAGSLEGRLEHMLVAYAESSARRRRIYKAIWKYRIGDAAICGQMQTIVLARIWTPGGRQMYRVWMTAPARDMLVPVSILS